MANATGEEGGGGGASQGLRMLSPEVLAAMLAADLDALSRRFQGTSWATVTNTDFLATAGYVWAQIGDSEIRVVCGLGAPLAVDQSIRVRRMSPDVNSVWEWVGGASNGTEYGLCFADPASNTVGSVYVNWGGTITSVETSGTGTAALTVGGASVGVGDSVASGSWLVATVSGGSGDYFSVAVMIG